VLDWDAAAEATTCRLDDSSGRRAVASAVPKRDVSVTWQVHKCGYRHPPLGDKPCPRALRWLIAGTPISDPYPLLVLGTRVKS
jgi:hypothetical protein